jgi:hypothetical protein
MKHLREKTISELARFLPAKRTEGDGIGELYMKATDSEWGAIPCKVLQLWAKSIVMECCPKKTPDSLGAMPTRCEGCERLMEMFEIEEDELI